MNMPNDGFVSFVHAEAGQVGVAVMQECDSGCFDCDYNCEECDSK